MENSNYDKAFNNRCYGCLSLRSGVFINSFCNVTLSFLADFTARSIERAYSEYITEDPTTFVTRYYHFTLPHMSTPVNAFSVVSNMMHIVGMIGCYKKSPKLVRYHKNYLWFDCITTPFALLESAYAYCNHRDNLAELSLDRKLMIYFSAFVGGIVLITYAQQIYSAYVAYKYERYLMLNSNDVKNN